MGRVDGKVVLITGAARGLGASFARMLVDEGATVLLTDVLDDLGKRTANEIGQRYEHLDVRSEPDWVTAVDGLVQQYGRVDVLINNAGILRTGSLEQTSLSEYLEVLQVNQIGCFLGMKLALPALRRSAAASVINISSSSAMKGGPGLIAYSASKWAVRGMTKCAAVELGADAIRVNSVHPGTVVTDMVGGNAEPLDRSSRGFPVPRAGRPDDVAPLVLFLAGDESRYCTGAEFLVDGGMTAGFPVIPR